MGLFNKVKAGVKNIDSKLGEEADVIGIKKKLNDKKNEADKIYREIGELAYKTKATFNDSDLKEFERLCGNLDVVLKDQAELEKELKHTKTKGHEEREANRKSA